MVYISIPTLFLAFINSPFINGLYALQYFIPVLTLAVLLCKLPKYHDIFFIKQEIDLIIMATLITNPL